MVCGLLFCRGIHSRLLFLQLQCRVFRYRVDLFRRHSRCVCFRRGCFCCRAFSSQCFKLFVLLMMCLCQLDLQSFLFLFQCTHRRSCFTCGRQGFRLGVLCRLSCCLLRSELGHVVLCRLVTTCLELPDAYVQLFHNVNQSIMHVFFLCVARKFWYTLVVKVRCCCDKHVHQRRSVLRALF